MCSKASSLARFYQYCCAEDAAQSVRCEVSSAVTKKVNVSWMWRHVNLYMYSDVAE